MGTKINVVIDGSAIQVDAGTTVASAILNSGLSRLRQSVDGQARGPVCGMGICYECRVRVYGDSYVRACMTVCEEGMEVSTDA